MITILNTNKKKLIEHIAKCRGSVYLHTKDGITYDLKNDAMASKLFSLMELPKDGVTLSLSDSKDFAGFVRYMMETSVDDQYSA